MSQARIWILEDDLELVALYEKIFNTHFVCDYFNSIKEFAYAQLTSKIKPDLMIADLLLPDGKFLPYVQLMKKIAYPYVVVSASDETEVLEDCFKNGASDFFVKPIKASEVLVKIER